MPNQFKIHELLKDHGDDLAQLEVYAREKGRSIDELKIWLESRGYVVSRGAVWNWKQNFDEQELALRMNASGGLAKAFMEAAKSGDGMQIPDAAVLQLSQMVFEQAAKLGIEGAVTTEDLANLALAMQRTTKSKRQIEDVRNDLKKRFDEQASKLMTATSGAQKRQITQSDIDEVRKAVFG